MKKKLLILIALFFGLINSLYAQQSLTLHQAYEAALSHNEKVEISEQEIDRASARIGQSIGHILPRVSLGLTETLQDPLPASFDSSLTKTNYQSATLTATQPIFHGLKDFHAIKAFRSFKESNRYLYEQAKRELFKEVAEVFLNLVAINKNMQTTQKMLAVMGDELNSLKEREKIGKVRTAESVRQESDRAFLEANYEKLKMEKLVNQEALAFLTGLASTTEISAQGLIPNNIGTLETYLEKSQSRPDLLAQAQTKKSAKSLVNVESADLYPQVDFMAHYYPYRTGYQKDIKWDMMFKLNLTLNPFTEIAEIREAKVTARQENLQYDEDVKNVKKEVMQSYAQANSYLVQAKKFRNAANLAEKSYRLQKADGAVGLVNQLDILTSQRSWMQVLQEANTAEVNAVRAYLNLLLKAGVSYEDI